MKDAFFNRIGAVAASAFERFKYSWANNAFEIFAGRAGPYAAKDRRADAKQAVVQIGQSDAGSDEIAPMATFTQVDAVFGADGFERFFLNERHIAAASGPSREVAAREKITIAFQAATGNNADFRDARQRPTGRRCDPDTAEDAILHKVFFGLAETICHACENSRRDE